MIGVQSVDGELKDKKVAARYLRVSVSTLERLVRAGRGPKCYQIGAQWRFRLEDLANYVESNPLEIQPAKAKVRLQLNQRQPALKPVRN